MNTVTEKRMSERYEVHRGSVANINGYQTYSTVTNISESGIAFICAPELKHGDQVDLAMEIQQGTETKIFHVIVEVVRCLTDDFEHHIGAVVRTATQEFKALLEEVQQSREKYGLTSSNNQNFTSTEHLNA